MYHAPWLLLSFSVLIRSRYTNTLPFFWRGKFLLHQQKSLFCTLESNFMWKTLLCWGNTCLFVCFLIRQVINTINTFKSQFFMFLCSTYGHGVIYCCFCFLLQLSKDCPSVLPTVAQGHLKWPALLSWRSIIYSRWTRIASRNRRLQRNSWRRVFSSGTLHSKQGTFFFLFYFVDLTPIVKPSKTERRQTYYLDAS